MRWHNGIWGLSGASGVVVLCAVMTGGAAGLGTFTFVYARGGSYLTNDPRACANCHVMNEQYDGWTKSSHHAVAVCNDCHTPHETFGKWATKARNGFNHSLAFTTGRFDDPIRITERNRAMTERACRHCHDDVVHMIDAVPRAGQPTDCLRCHRDVGHKH